MPPTDLSGGNPLASPPDSSSAPSTAASQSTGDIIRRLLPSVISRLESSGASSESSTPSPPTPSTPSPPTPRPSRARAPGRLATTVQDENEPRPARRQRLQEEKLKHKRLFETKVEIVNSAKGIAGKIYRCKDCSAVKPTQLQITNHVASCGNPFKGKKRGKNSRLKYTCNQCGWKAGTLARLAKHRREEHIPANRRPAHRCTTCGKSFKYSRSLRRHLLTHLDVPRHLCPTCSTPFSRAEHLRRHMEIHQREALQPATSASSSLVQQGRVTGGGQGSKWGNFQTPEDSRSDEEEFEFPDEEEEAGFSVSAFSEVLRSYGRSPQEVELDIRRAQQQQLLTAHGLLLTPHGHLLRHNAEGSSSFNSDSYLVHQSEDEVGHFTSYYSFLIPTTNQGLGGQCTNVVQMQLQPGTQYIFEVPPARLPPQSTSSATSRSTAPPETSETGWNCSVCNHPFRDKFNLAQHVKTMHTVKEGGYPCRHRAF